MIRRIFAFADLPCHARFTAPDGAELRVPVQHVARAKAVLECDLALEAGLVVAVLIEYPDGTSSRLTARVADSAGRGLFLVFQHEDSDEEAAFGGRLIQASEAYLTMTEAAREEARSGLRNTILQRSRTMNSSVLAQRSAQVRVVDMKAITGMIEDALAEALARADRAFTDEEREKLLQETEATFQQRLNTLQAEKAGAEEQVVALQQELARAQDVLEEERSRVIENDRFTVSDAGMAELDHRLGRIIENALRTGDVDAETEAKMREIVARLLDDERDKIGSSAREAQSDAIELLERKVARLAQTLDKTAKAREIAEHRAAALEAAGGGMGMRSVMDAGLHAEDPMREKKLALLKEIVKENDAVRVHIQRVRTGQVAPAAAAVVDDGGVKKIEVKRVKPPPLARA